MKGRGRGDDDEDRHDVGEEHAEIGVDADATEFQRRLFRRAFERLGVGALLDLFDLLLSLPEEEIRADRGAQDILVEAVKKQRAEIKELREEVAALKAAQTGSK